MSNGEDGFLNIFAVPHVPNFQSPLVSLIVSCFNIEKYVPACLESIAAQTYTHLDVILVDDGSTDETGVVLRRFAGDHAGWRVLSKQNGGPSSARNAGIVEAKGEWLVFVDGDDMLAPRSVETLLGAAIDSGASLVCANHYVQSRGKDVVAWPAESDVRSMSQREAFQSVLYHREIDVSAWGKIYARNLFECVRYPEGRIYEDTYVFDEILAEVDRVLYLGVPLYHYVVRSGSIVNVEWSGKQSQFIEAVDKFTAHAESLYPHLAQGAHRRRMHARLSVLRYMENVMGKDTKVRDRIVAQIRRGSRSLLTDRNAPIRDKAGVILVLLSPRLFFSFWRFYSSVRKDR